MNMRYIIPIIFICVISAWWISFNSYCSARFDYCHEQAGLPNGECGVYFIDRWQYRVEYAIMDFALSFVRCEGVLD